MAGLPGIRLPKLRQLIKSKGIVRAMETHNGLCGLMVESVKAAPIGRPNEMAEFDAFWSSSLTASASKGLPDIETVDTTARLGLVRDTLAVTSKPLIYDGDTGGLPEIFKFTVRQLEELGVSACIIEDKTGLKQNSLFGTDRKQQLESVDDFCAKMAAGQEAKRHEDFMIIARIEALIAGLGLEEALMRAKAYTEHVDGIMIHSKDKDPAEIFEFIERYNKLANAKPIIVVPTTYNHVTEDEFAARGVKVVIYANHLLRAAYPAMHTVAQTILKNGRSLETDAEILPVKKIINLIDSNPLTGGKAPKAKPATGGAAPPSDPAKNLSEFMGAIEAADVEFTVGVPDSLLSSVQVALEQRASGSLEIAANEGAAVAMAAGHYFQTQKVPLVYLQNSGLGNVINPIMSLCHKDVYGVPMVMLVGWRGAPGTKDEPQHVVQGKQTVDMLKAMGVPHAVVPKGGDIKGVVAKAFKDAKTSGAPVALLVEPETFPSKKLEAAAADFKREDAISGVLAELGDVPVVATTGFPAREVFEVRKARGEGHDRDFLTVGSMGHAIAIAQGIARAQPAKSVVCLDGDGGSIMHMGSAALSATTPNLCHIMMNNRCHDSVGGQPTAPVDFTAVMTALGYEAPPAVDSPAALTAALKAYAAGGKRTKPFFLEVRVGRGTRKDLGRPTHSPPDAKALFMKYLGSRL